MVLVMAGQEARPRERRLKTLEGELENNSGKPRDLSPHIRWSTMLGGGKSTNGQHDTFGGPSWVSHLPAKPHDGLTIRPDHFIHLFCDCGR